MNIKRLNDTIVKLNSISNFSLEEYSEKIPVLVAKVNELMIARNDIQELVGDDNIDMMKNNHSNHAFFVKSILSQFDPETLIQTVLWVFKSYRSRGFLSNYWVAQLNTWIEVLRNELSSEAFEEILPLYEWFIVNIPVFSKLSEQVGEPDNLHIIHE